MSSWRRQINLLFWLGLAAGTVVLAVWLPGYLDSSKENSYRELPESGKPAMEVAARSRASTRFPTRAFSASASQAQPAQQTSPSTNDPDSSGGLPQRTVPGVEGNSRDVGERMTTRAWVKQTSNVHSSPQTTSTVLGRIDAGTQVRWLANSGEGWEEILLKDGRSAFLQSSAMSFTSVSGGGLSGMGRSTELSGASVDIATLATTVESFLQTLSQSDLLRAETYLSPSAPELNEAALGALIPLLGGRGRLLRMEPFSGHEDGMRSVLLVNGDDLSSQIQTVWEWDRGQGRWLLLRW